ncbi:MAG TPA: hypothetical protein VF691_11540 [Cytophagaceae bacterium]|jgi:hypothetical protein
MKNKVNHLIAFSAVLSMNCMVSIGANAQTTGTGTSNAGANSQEQVAPNSTQHGTIDYTPDANMHTARMQSDLKLKPEQETKLKSVNQQRATKMNEAYKSKSSDTTALMRECNSIEEWADAEYKSILDAAQYTTYASGKNTYNEFKYKTPTTKVKGTSEELKVKNETSTVDQKVKVQSDSKKGKKTEQEVKIKSKSK